MGSLMSKHVKRNPLEHMQAARFSNAKSTLRDFEAWVLPDGTPVIRGVCRAHRDVPSSAIYVGRYVVPGADVELFLDDVAESLRAGRA
jgi:hypothetical protein